MLEDFISFLRMPPNTCHFSVEGLIVQIEVDEDIIMKVCFSFLLSVEDGLASLYEISFFGIVSDVVGHMGMSFFEKMAPFTMNAFQMSLRFRRILILLIEKPPVEFHGLPTHVRMLVVRGFLLSALTIYFMVVFNLRDSAKCREVARSDREERYGTE